MATDCTDQVCSCSCSGWEITQGRAALSVTAANELGISAGFGLHIVDVEAYFTSEMGDMMSDYDAFVDFNDVGLYYTTDLLLDQYTGAAFDRQVASRQLA